MLVIGMYSLPQYLRRVGWCLVMDRILIRLSVKPGILLEIHLLSTYFFDFFFYDSLTLRDYSRREIFRFYKGFLYKVFENS